MRVDGTNFTGCSSLLFSFLEKNQCHSIRLHISLSLSVLRSSKKIAIFKNINSNISSQRISFFFFLSTLFPNYYRCFKIRFYGTLFPFFSHCDIFYSVCHLTIQHQMELNKIPINTHTRIQHYTYRQFHHLYQLFSISTFIEKKVSYLKFFRISKAQVMRQKNLRN